MDLKKLQKEHRLIDLFVQLAEIPSPSLKEDKLSKRIKELFDIYGINSNFDAYGNLIAKIPASVGYKNVPPLLISAHMDVVGGSEPVEMRLSSDGKYIETNKLRTLGADNKAGVAAILDLAIELNNLSSSIEHGPIEIIYTRDEERGMTGIRNLDTSKLNSKYAIIADGECLGELDVAGAGFTNVLIKIFNGIGGHSGININDANRVSAVKVMSELDQMIPQGVYKQTEEGVITSINAGIAAGGTLGTYFSESVKEICGQKNNQIPVKYSADKIFDTINEEASLNVIATDACLAYSIRSSDPENEIELLNLVKSAVNDLNTKYSKKIKISMQVHSHLRPFVKNVDQSLVKIIKDAGVQNKLTCNPVSFHAGAETHVLANEKKNSAGDSFIPVIVGLANLENIHSNDEKIDWKSFLTGRKWLEDIVINFAKEYKSS